MTNPCKPRDLSSAGRQSTKPPRPLLTLGNPKTAKGEGRGYLTAILHLAPARVAGVGNMCPWSTSACRDVCLNLAGRGGIFRHGETTNAIQAARIARTQLFASNRPAFLAQLEHEINAHVRRARRAGLKPAVRLNGTSDLPWESIGLTSVRDVGGRPARSIVDLFPAVKFYDYTKSANRVHASLRDAWTNWPANYTLTFSWSGKNAEACAHVLAVGGTVAVPFSTRRGAPLPESFLGAPVADGDVTDLRFLDTPGTIIGLRAKGPARHDVSWGFVVSV